MLNRSRLLLMIVLPMLGCSAKLETGYDYQPLSSSPNERRAYYATPFSPESVVAEQDRSDEFRSRRPTNY